MERLPCKYCGFLTQKVTFERLDGLCKSCHETEDSKYKTLGIPPKSHKYLIFANETLRKTVLMSSK